MATPLDGSDPQALIVAAYEKSAGVGCDGFVSGRNLPDKFAFNNSGTIDYINLRNRASDLGILSAENSFTRALVLYLSEAINFNQNAANLDNAKILCNLLKLCRNIKRTLTASGRKSCVKNLNKLSLLGCIFRGMFRAMGGVTLGAADTNIAMISACRSCCNAAERRWL